MEKQAKEYVLRACTLLKIDLHKPTKKSPGILGMKWEGKKGSVVIDADDWAIAKQQLEAWRTDPKRWTK